MSESHEPERLRDVAALAARYDDDFLRAEADPQRVASCWAMGDAVGWVTSSRRVPGRAHLVALGDDRDAAGLLLALADEHGIASVTLPRDADRHLPAYRLDPRNDWEWFVTRTPPPAQPGEDAVAWLAPSPETDAELIDLLRAWSPRHDVDPGQPSVRRWAGLRDERGTLVAAAAHTEHRAGVPHLASVVTHGQHRGQGLGAAVCAWLTRSLLAEGTGWVTLGMYSDNDVGRRLYRRLGYANDHHFTSGRLLER
ncbi:MAG TPA: GNAT family N-acetyltransferase [Actinomycetes bacterium]